MTYELFVWTNAWWLMGLKLKAAAKGFTLPISWDLRATQMEPSYRVVRLSAQCMRLAVKSLALLTNSFVRRNGQTGLSNVEVTRFVLGFISVFPREYTGTFHFPHCEPHNYLPTFIASCIDEWLPRHSWRETLALRDYSTDILTVPLRGQIYL